MSFALFFKPVLLTILLTAHFCGIIGLTLKETEIKKFTKAKWNKTVNDLIESIALKDLLKENETKTKTRHLKYKT